MLQVGKSYTLSIIKNILRLNFVCRNIVELVNNSVALQINSNSNNKKKIHTYTLFYKKPQAQNE